MGVEFGPLFFAAAVPAVLFAAISKGGFGSGASFAAAPLLALVLEPALAVALLLPLLMLMDVGALRPYWRRWRMRESALLMAGAVPGIAAGAVFFQSVSADALRVLLGVVALGFVAWEVARARGLVAPRPARAAAGLGWGALCGFTSFVSHAGGPPAAVYLLGRRLDKTAYQATTVLVFFWVNALKFPAYVGLGLFSTDMMLAAVLLAPVALGGVLVGVWCHERVPEPLFFAITYVLLVVTGMKLLWDGLV